MRYLFMLLGLGSLLTGCAKAIPETEGVYLRQGREWVSLQPVDSRALTAAQPVDLKALQAVQLADASDAPRLVFVGRVPRKVAALRRDGKSWKPMNFAVAPHEERKNVWEAAFESPAPAGLIVLRFDGGPQGVGLMNGPDAAYYNALGAAHNKAKNFTAAREAYASAVKADPKNASYKNEMALTLAALGADLGDARGFANEAIAAASDDRERALYYDTLGAVYAADGDIDKAMEAIDRAVSLDLRNPAFHVRMAEIITKAQEVAPDEVLRQFYDYLGRGKFGDAADLASKFDVERLEDAGKLKDTLKFLARGAPFTRVEIQSTIKHGKVARFRYLLVGQDGGQRVEDIQLQFEDRHWTVSLP